jgi:hypothetical protein
MHNVGVISNQTGKEASDPRVIMNAAGRMRDENPSIVDAIASMALDPTNLAFAPLGDANAVRKLAGAKSAVEEIAGNVGKSLAAGTPGPAEDFTRLYRGEPALGRGGQPIGPLPETGYPGAPDRGRWFSTHPEVGKAYGGGKTDYVDISNKELAMHDPMRVLMPGGTYKLPPRIANQKQPFVEPGSLRAAITKFNVDQAGELKPDKILDMMRKSPKKDERITAQLVDKLVSEGTPLEDAIRQVTRFSEMGSAPEGAAAAASADPAVEAVANNLSSRGTTLRAEGQKVVGQKADGSPSSFSKYFPTPEAAADFAKNVNDRLAQRTLDSGQRVPELTPAQIAEAKAPLPAQQETQTALDAVRTSITNSARSPEEKQQLLNMLDSIQPELMNDVGRQVFEQTSFMGPNDFKGDITKTPIGENLPQGPVNPDQTLGAVTENIPGQQWDPNNPGFADKNIHEVRGDLLREKAYNKDAGLGPNTVENLARGGSSQLGTGDSVVEQLFNSSNQMTLFPESSVENIAHGPNGPVDVRPGGGTGDASQNMIDAGIQTGDHGNPPIGALAKTALGGVSDWSMRAPRQIMASLDISATLRQGGIAAVAHNPEWRKAVAHEFEALKSEAGYNRVAAEIQKLDSYDLGQAVNLKSGMGENVNRGRYEAMEGPINADTRLVGGFVHVSDRAYEAFLSSLRANIFDTYAKKFGLVNDDILAMTHNADRLPGGGWGASQVDLGKNTAEVSRGDQILSLLSPAKQKEAQQLADFVNSMTGRGNLGWLEKNADGLNSLFFSPRFFASRINNIFAPLVYTGSAAFGGGSWNVAKMAWRDMIGFYGTSFSLITLAGQIPGVDIELDPRSVRFGNISFGDHHIDITGGMNRTAAEFYQLMIVGSKIDSAGAEKSFDNPAFGDVSFFNELANFMRQKANAPVSSVIDLKSGNRNVVGEPRGITGHVPMPIIVKNILDAVSSDLDSNGTGSALIAGVATAAAEAIGINSSTYSVGSKRRDIPGGILGNIDQAIYGATGIGKSPSRGKPTGGW